MLTLFLFFYIMTIMKKIINSNLFFLFILTIIIFIVYGKSINFGITNFDDDELIYNNMDFISDIRNIPEFFLNDCYFKKDTQYYRPVLNISFSLESFLFKDNLKVYHTTNILLYIISLFIIFVLLSKLNFNKTIVKFLVLLFAVHPVLSSIPVWIPARNDTLLTVFFLLSLINFINYIKTDKIKYLVLHFLFFFLSLFLKETMLLLIFIYPLLIYCFNFKINKKQIINNCFFVVPILIIYFILRHYSVQPVYISIYFNNFLYYMKNIFVGFMLYIEKLFYPATMPIMIYDIMPALQTYIVSICIVLFLIFVCYKKVIDKKIFIFAILFSFLAILPTFALEDYLFFTHRLIISLPGILIILTLMCEKLIKTYNKANIYLIIVFVLLFPLFAFCSFMQTDKYKNSLIYWINAYKDAPNFCIAYSGLAKEFIFLGNYDKAIELLFEAKKIKNKYAYDLDICSTFIAKGELDKAKERLLRMTKLKDDFLTFRYLSEIFYIQGDLENSKIYADKAMKINPTDNVILNHYKKLTDALNGKK